jgi:hypothetical protein
MAQYPEAFGTQRFAMEPLIEGMQNFLRTNLVAYSPLIADAFAGDTEIFIENTFRFNDFDDILIMDDNAAFDADTQAITGVEFLTVDGQPTEVTRLKLSSPLQKDFLVADNGRMQKSIKRTILQQKDILYGDRAVITFDYVAVTIEPEAKSQEWIALEGLLSSEYRMSIIVYVKSGGQGDEEETAIRVVSAYADAINSLLMGNIHLDLAIDSTPILADVCIGDTSVVIGSNVAHAWPADTCSVYDIQDNFHSEHFFGIVDPHESSSSSSSCLSTDYGSTSSVRSSNSSVRSSSSSSSSVNSSSTSSESSLSSSSSRSSSSSSTSTQSGTSSSSDSTSSQTPSSSSSPSTSSSQSSMGGDFHEVMLTAATTTRFNVENKPFLRRNKRYFYDSRVENIEYGTVQKGSAVLKAARITWYGKETNSFIFPQVGRG